MRRRPFATRLLAVLAAFSTLFLTVAADEPQEYGHDWAGPWFGDENWDLRCDADVYPEEGRGWQGEDGICHHMRTNLNMLDSPEVDVLIMVPVSPMAERDTRVMRQSVEMWEVGIDWMAQKMGLQWLADGLNFHVTVAQYDPAGGNGEFTTYPIVDPEIVIVASNPVGGIGIGVDPIGLFGMEGLCTGLPNPAGDYDFWENIPGYDSHHDERTGTYTEDCGGAGGNICFAINGAIDPDPSAETPIFGLFDLLSHEFGHCLTIGHVGDGAEGSWSKTPTSDIMAYQEMPGGLTKCVSSLDVEAVAAWMSSYLDVNGDGVVDDADHLLENNQAGDGRNAFQVQHPDDHFYASSTGSPFDCPQPDLGLFPGPRTDWNPDGSDGS